jgi:catechol 2,3-dioxygenase-like lactoylglutathione lyase family enzyme
VEQRLSLVTLGVTDLARARSFYEALGWVTGAAPGDDVVFFQAGGMILALWGRLQLADDSGVTDAGGWGGVTLAQNVRSPAEVDRVLADRGRRRDDRPAGSGDVLGRLRGRLRRPRRPPVGGRAQPALDASGRRLDQPLRLTAASTGSDPARSGSRR